MSPAPGAATSVDREPRDPRALAARLADLERHRSIDVEARLAAARELEREALLTGDDEAVARARLVAADMLPRLGDVVGGARLAAEVHEWATSHDRRNVLARSHLVLSSIFEGIGDAPLTLDHAVRAIDLLGPDAPARERGNHLLRLADALAFSGATDQAHRRYAEAAELFTGVGDRERLLIVLNNITVLGYESGDAAATIAAVERFRAELTHDDMNSDFADTIARALLATGDLVGAESAARHGLGRLALDGATMAIAPAELSLTLAEIALARGDVALAQAELNRCTEICRERNLAGVMAMALEVQSRVFATVGDFEHAYRTHREYHTRSTALRSQQHEAAARTREALFETAEARRQAEQFRLQARLDPLTELYNRRFVDETLPDWLAAAGAPDGRPVTVAIVDLDHFKRINDEASHAAGDEVLRQVARVLADSAMPAGSGAPDLAFAARIGGEEFVIVDRRHPPAEAAAAIERLRRDVAERDWSALTSGLRVTISAGLAVARPGESQQALLDRADAHLHAAKAAGRNRVVGD